MALEFVETVGRGNNPGTPTITFNTDSSESIEEQLDRQSKEVTRFVAKSLGYPEPRFNLSNKDQEFAFALEAEEIGKDLIHRFHGSLEIYEIRVEYVFLKNTPVKNGREILGRAKKVSGLNAWLALPEKMRLNVTKPDVFFVIELAWEWWRRMPKTKRIALVDHELSHCGINEKAKPTMNSHDCEEFNQVVERHGVWTNDVRELIAAAKESEKNPLFVEDVGETSEEDLNGKTEEVDF